MNYVGIDIHKKYSVLCALDESGGKLREGRVEGNSLERVCAVFCGARRSEQSSYRGMLELGIDPRRARRD